jgi:hypothetical protein
VFRAVVFAGAAVVAACAPQEQKIASTLTEAELAPYRKPGQTTVRGQAFLRQQGGGVVTCAGEAVQLAPLTGTMRESLQVARACKRVVVSGPTQIGPRITRTSTCDAQGNFRFDSIPSGEWVLITKVRWLVGGAQQGGELAKEISVPSKGTAETLLADRDRLCSR